MALSQVPLTANGAQDLTLDFGYIKAVPSVDVEKYSGDTAPTYDAAGKLLTEAPGDFDTASETVNPLAPTTINFTIVNNGNEPLTGISVADATTSGTGDLTGLVCTFPDASTGVAWDGTLAVGQSFTCTGVLPALGENAIHQNTVTVNATGTISGEETTDDDPYNSTTSTLPRVSVGDFVWNDLNADGLQDAGEPGIPGVTLTLTGPDGQSVKDVLGNPVEPVTTGADGSYSFTNLPPLADGESYTVTVTPPAGYVATLPGVGDDRGADSSTGDAASQLPLTVDGANDPTLDFGFVKPIVSVGDFVWEDTNKDGVQDAGEPGIPGVTLTLTGPDGQPVTDVDGNPVAPVVTGANGEYLFENLPILEAGQSYTVTVTEPAGYFPTVESATDDPALDSDAATGLAASGDLSADGAKDLTLDFGYIKAVPSVDVQKYSGATAPTYDAAGNVVADAPGDFDAASETVDPLAPTTISFTVINNGNEPLTGISLADATTAGTGTLTDLVCTFPDGTTGLSWNGTLAVGESFTCTGTLPALGENATHTNTVTVNATGTISGQTTTDDDPYTSITTELPRVTVGDYVWEDTDRDGIQDDGEPGIPGVTLTLTGPDGQPVKDVLGNPVPPVTTGADGSYSFTNLPPLGDGESYTVTVTPPAGYLPTTPGAGNDRGKDSSTGTAASGNLTKGGDSDTSLDFGFVKPVTPPPTTPPTTPPTKPDIPKTGADIMGGALAAMLMLGAGAGLLALRRRQGA